MNVLITGGAGFIGSHLCEELLARREHVHIIDDLSTGSIKNVEHLKKNERFTYTIDSVFNEPVTAELIDRADVVYHLAAAVGTRLVVENPVRTIETNIGGTEIVLKHANKKKKTVILASTSEIYGKSENLPFKEDDDMVLGPTSKTRWSYACSKAIDEFLAIAYWKEHKLPVIVVRLFNTVGPRQTGRYGMVLPRFVSNALSGRPLEVYGDGKQTRCFCYVGDVTKALVKIAGKPKAYGGVFNLGSDSEISIKDLALKVKARVNPKVKIKLIPYEEAYEKGFEDLRHRMPDTSRIKKLIGFRPTLDINDIIDTVAEHLRFKN